MLPEPEVLARATGSRLEPFMKLQLFSFRSDSCLPFTFPLTVRWEVSAEHLLMASNSDFCKYSLQWGWLQFLGCEIGNPNGPVSCLVILLLDAVDTLVSLTLVRNWFSSALMSGCFSVLLPSAFRDNRNWLFVMDSVSSDCDSLESTLTFNITIPKNSVAITTRTVQTRMELFFITM